MRLRRPRRRRAVRSADVTTNWARNQRWLPSRVVDARSTDDVVAAIRSADGLPVKALGAGHSFTPAAATDGVQISVDAMDRVLDVDRDAKRVRVEAGIRLHQLSDALAAVDLAMPNLGDIDRQSIAGAVATATHGTGIGLGGLATTVVGMELVTGRGEVITIDEREDPELLRVARVGLGALGVVTEVTLQCVDAFTLHARETIEVLDDVLDGFAEHAGAVDHFELYWMPGGGDRCQVKRNRRTDEARRPQGRLAYVRDKWLAENLAFGAACRVGRRMPSTVPRIARLVSSSAGGRELIDRSDRVFCSPRHVRFVEMEYGIPVEHVADSVRRVRQLTTTLEHPVLFPIEVRVSAADDIPLSTGFGRTSGWVAVHQYRNTHHVEYFKGVEAIMDDYGGRPHWGKVHYQRADSLDVAVPRWHEFHTARDRLDPDRTFANRYLERVLGP